VTDTDEGDSKRGGVRELWELERRRVLQLAGAGIGSLGIVGAGTGVASAASNCADGPFERTYEGGTVNFGQIQSKGDRESPPDMSAAEPGRGRGRGRDESGPPFGRGRDTEGDGTLEIGTEYEGLGSNDTRGGVPSDSQIATGRSKNVHAVNQQVAIYNKRSGTKQRQVDLEDIWEPVIPEPEGGFALGYPFVFDPRARYDRNEDRFVLCATQFVMGLTTDGEMIGREEVEEGEVESEAISRAPRGYFVVAVSQNSNPNGTWNVYRLPPEDETGVDNAGLVDYPTLGVDQDAVYLTQNFFANDGDFEVTMVTLDKAELYAGEPVTAHHFDNMNSTDEGAPFTFTVQPAFQPFSGGESGTYYMVNSGFTSNALTLWEVTDPTTDPSLSCYTVEVGPYSPPPTADQPNTESDIDTVGSRLMNADYNDGSLWTAHTVAAGGVAAIRWYEIDVESRELVQSGIYGEPDRSYYIPTVKSNDDTTIIVHNVSGPDTFARMDVAGRTADFTPGEIEDSVVVQDGESKYDALPGSVERWGDYNGVSLDPQTGNIWTVSQYSPDVNIPVSDSERDPYATRIAEVFFGDDQPGNGRGPPEDQGPPADRGRGRSNGQGR
jgi:hypothetical protein